MPLLLGIVAAAGLVGGIGYFLWVSIGPSESNPKPDAPNAKSVGEKANGVAPSKRKLWPDTAASFLPKETILFVECDGPDALQARFAQTGLGKVLADKEIQRAIQRVNVQAAAAASTIGAKECCGRS